MALTEANKRARLTGIGASEIPAVIGISPWSSPIQVYESKVSPVEEEPNGEPNDDLERGQFQEDGTLRWTAHRRKILVIPNDELVRHATHHFCIATPDGYEVEPPLADGDANIVRVGVIEVKSPRSGDRWKKPDEDPRGFPNYYLAQVQWQMLATGLPRAILSAVVWGRLWIYDIEADADLQSALLEAGEAFWRRVEERDPPPLEKPGDSSVYGRLFEQKTDKLVQPADVAEAVVLAREYRKLKALEKAAKDDAEVIKGRLVEQIGAAQGLDLGEHGIVTWNQAKDTNKTEWEKVARESGTTHEIIAKHTKTVRGSRRIAVKLVGEPEGDE
jgi:putative phage-type endonuclease